MKLIVIIPAYNEEQSVAAVVKAIPRSIKGIESVKVLVYDDGSSDNTVSVAKKAGADYVFSHPRNYGLARTFKDSLKKALELGADIIVNTDADDQYNQEEIALLIPPILEKKADLVIGDRQVEKLPHMTSFKKYGNMVGSFMIRLLTGTTVSDASSGFRALSSECARILTLFSAHTYTHEMIIDAHFKNLLIVQVPITFKQRAHGTSRLMSKGVIRHIFKSVATIIRTVLLYQAFTVFTFLGSIISLFGLIGIGRYLYLVFFLGQSEGHIQSLVLSSVLIGMGFNILILGFIADLISYNRRLIEEKNEVR